LAAAVLMEHMAVVCVVGGVVMAVVVLLGGGHVLLRVGACWHGDGRRCCWHGAGGVAMALVFCAMALEVMLPTRRLWLCCYLPAWLFNNLFVPFVQAHL
jgi:hypothetical protein